MNGGIRQAWVPYCGSAPEPAELLARWNFDPLLLVPLAGLLIWHVATARDRENRHAMLAALAVLAVLFVSPFCALTSALFSARAAHHAILIAVAAPLLAWSMPDTIPRGRLPLTASTAVATLTLWAWHLPAFYAAALSNDAIYWLMQASLLGTAVGFWLAVRHSSVPAAVVALLATMVQMGLLGALLTFSNRAFYAPHLQSTWAWGFSPLEDQQLAGLIMWAPAAALYLLAALVLAGRWLHQAQRPA